MERPGKLRFLSSLRKHRSLWFFWALCSCMVGLPASAQELLPNGQQQFVDSNGQPLVGGNVYFYSPGTTSAKTTWQDINESVPNTNPVILNAAGRATIWGTGAYREIVYDQFGNLIWDQLTYGFTQTAAGANGFGAQGTLPGGALTDLGTISTNNVLVTGSSSIGSFGSSASTAGPVFLVRFTGTNTLTYNATSMVLPGGVNLVTSPGDTGIFVYLGSGNWYCYQYQGTKVSPLASGFGTQVTVASASTTTLPTPTQNILISGSASINSFGNAAGLAQPVYLLGFSGAATLVNSAGLVLPGGQNILTSSGDSALGLYEGAGTWKVLAYNKVLAQPGPAVLHSSSFTSSGTYAIPAGVNRATPLELLCQGPGAGGGSNSGGNGGGGGGGGAGAYADELVSGFTGGTNLTITVSAGGTGSSSSGSNGSDGAGPTKFTYNGVDFLTCNPGSGGVSGINQITNAGGNGGTVSTNYGGAGLTLLSSVLRVSGQAAGSGKYQGNSIAQSGQGGSTPLGQGGPSAHSIVGTFTTGPAGNGFGAGSAGGASGDTTQSNAQNGAPGIAIVKYTGP